MLGPPWYAAVIFPELSQKTSLGSCAALPMRLLQLAFLTGRRGCNGPACAWSPSRRCALPAHGPPSHSRQPQGRISARVAPRDLTWPRCPLALRPNRGFPQQETFTPGPGLFNHQLYQSRGEVRKSDGDNDAKSCVAISVLASHLVASVNLPAEKKIRRKPPAVPFLAFINRRKY